MSIRILLLQQDCGILHQKELLLQKVQIKLKRSQKRTRGSNYIIRKDKQSNKRSRNRNKRSNSNRTNRVKEVESYKIIRQNTQYQEKADSIAKGIKRVRVPEIIEDIQLVENSIEIYPYKNKIEERLEQLAEIGKTRYCNTSLDCSTWASNSAVYKDKGEFKAKVAAVKILEDNTEQREKSIRQLLRGNKHIKMIQEKFANEINSVLFTLIAKEDMKKPNQNQKKRRMKPTS